MALSSLDAAVLLPSCCLHRLEEVPLDNDQLLADPLLDDVRESLVGFRSGLKLFRTLRFS